MDLIIDLSENIALLVAFTFVYGKLHPVFAFNTGIFSQIFHGCLFSAIAITGMLIPIELLPGVLMDGRTIVVALAAPFGGPWASIIAGVFVSIYRFTLGGIGVYSGIAAILIGALCGVLFVRLVREDAHQIKILHFLTLGFASAVLGLLTALCLPDPVIAKKAFTKYFFPVMGYYPVCAVFLGVLLRGEMKNYQTAQDLKDSKLKYRNLVENAVIGIFQVTEKGNFLVVNTKMAHMFGYESSKVFLSHHRNIIDLFADLNIQRKMAEKMDEKG